MAAHDHGHEPSGCEYGRATRYKIDSLATKDDLRDVADELAGIIRERKGFWRGVQLMVTTLAVLGGLIGLVTWARGESPKATAHPYHWPAQVQDAGSTDN